LPNAGKKKKKKKLLVTRPICTLDPWGVPDEWKARVERRRRERESEAPTIERGKRE